MDNRLNWNKKRTRSWTSEAVPINSFNCADESKRWLKTRTSEHPLSLRVSSVCYFLYLTASFSFLVLFCKLS